MSQAILSILIVGSSWIFLPSQVAAVGPEFAVAYRLFLGGIALLTFNLLYKKECPKLDAKFFGRIFVYAIFMYSINYLLCYEAAKYIPSGYIALIISAMIIPNIIYGRLFLKKKITYQALLGALLSLSGLGLVFLPQTILGGAVTDMGMGLGFVLMSIFFSGFGTVLGVKLNQQYGYDVSYAAAFGLIIGGTLSFIYAVTQYQTIRFSTDVSFVRDLLYLGLFTIPFVFVVYGKIAVKYGADKAGYIWVMAPIISLTLSTFFEGVTWDPLKIVGVIVTLFGSTVALMSRDKLLKFARIVGETKTAL